MKYMDDLKNDQCDGPWWCDGAFASTAPYGQYGTDRYGAVGWADAGIIIPYTLYQMYADTSVITENWDAMRKFMDVFCASDRNGECIEDRHYGDWLAYESNDQEIKGILCVAYYAWDAMMMSEMAKAIGEDALAEKYHAVYEQEKEIFISRYINADGTLKRGEQTICLYALYLDLLPNEASIKAVSDQLISNIERNGNKLQTGFLGTKIIMNTLTKIGRSDVAYKLLLQHDNPSWLYSVDQGATTIWERWDSYTLENGFNPGGMNSFNHYSYGAVPEWMFDDMAGISCDQNDPGFKNIVLAPHPNPLIQSVSASYESAYGTITADSAYEGDMWNYSVTVPANTTADVSLPVENIRTLTVNGKAYTQTDLTADGIEFVEEKDGRANFKAVAGKFSFRSNVTKVAPKPVLGDADDNGDINVADVLTIRRHLAGGSVSINRENADVNQDGDISITDAAELRKFLGGGGF